MANYASNTPVSRPRNTGWNVNWDCNGMVWSNDWGMFFEPVAELSPIKPPARVIGTNG